jgi:hypothetical protein
MLVGEVVTADPVVGEPTTVEAGEEDPCPDETAIAAMTPRITRTTNSETIEIPSSRAWVFLNWQRSSMDSILRKTTTSCRPRSSQPFELRLNSATSIS